MSEKRGKKGKDDQHLNQIFFSFAHRVHQNWNQLCIYLNKNPNSKMQQIICHHQDRLFIQ